MQRTKVHASETPARPPTPYDALPEESFDRIARIAAAALRSPVAIVSLLDDDRHVVKSSVGLTGRSRVWRKVPLAQRYARQVVSSGRAVFVGNTADDKANTERHGSAPDGVAYAVAPIALTDGHVIGTICVIDTSPHAWTHAEVNALMDSASMLVTELELRSDLSLKRQTQEHLLYSTLHDSLTGLPNRSLLIERLRHAMRRAARHPDDLFAVLFLDLDRFRTSTTTSATLPAMSSCAPSREDSKHAFGPRTLLRDCQAMNSRSCSRALPIRAMQGG